MCSIFRSSVYTIKPNLKVFPPGDKKKTNKQKKKLDKLLLNYYDYLRVKFIVQEVCS